MAWNTPCPLDCTEVQNCITLYNTVETCVDVAETGETLNVYKVIIRDSNGNYIGVDHYEWFDHSPTTGFTVTENTGPCNCCDAVCAKPFLISRTCPLYTSLGSTYTFGPSGFLSDPSIFHDPCGPPNTPADCVGFDYRCTNMYPIQVVFNDAAYSTDGGATWTHFTPSTITYNSTADVTYSDAGYGLGWDGLANAINPFLVGTDIRLQPAAGNGGVWEYANGATEATHLVRVSWRWFITGGNCEGVDGVDPYELAWAAEWQLTSNDGQSYGRSDGNSLTPPASDDVENPTGFTFAGTEPCTNI